MTTPPGWYPYGEAKTQRWWDGAGWSNPQDDSRIRPGTATVFDGLPLAFVPDSAWPPAPDDFYPAPMWEPKPGWPQPEEHLWQVLGLGMEARLDELSERLEILESIQQEKSADAWRLDDLSTVPMVWTPPPNWPPVPRGWSPPDRWKPPRHLGRAPKDWQFWQHDPEIIKARTSTIHAAADRRSRAMVGTATGLATLLSFAESYLCSTVQITPLALSPLPSAIRNGLHTPVSSDLASALRSAHQHLNWTVSNLRTYLLRIAYGVDEADQWLWRLRLSVVDATEAYRLAAKTAAQSVLDNAEARLSAEIGRLTSAPRHRQRLADMSQALAELNADAEARSRALNPSREVASTTATPAAGWEEAEELAAEHVRSLGFRDAVRTPVGSDGGFDVEGRGVVAQVKYKATAVGRPDIQRLVGANQHGARSAFYSRAGYSQSAIDYATQAGVALYVLDASNRRVEPANQVAETFSA